MNKEFKIWYKQYDDDGKCIGTGVYHKSYKRPGYAEKIAKERYNKKNIWWVISTENPFIVTCEFCGEKFEIRDRHPYRWVTDSYISVVVTNPKSLEMYRWRNICPDCARKAVELIESLKKEK